MADLCEELTNAIDRAARHGHVPKSGGIVVDAYKMKMMENCSIEALHIIAELLDRIDELKEE